MKVQEPAVPTALKKIHDHIAERRQGRNATTYKQCYNMTTTCTVCGKNIQMASLTRHHMQKQHSIYL